MSVDDRLGPPPGTRNEAHLATPRLELTPPRPEDADAIFRMVHGPAGRAVTRTLVWDGPVDHAEVREWIDKCREQPFDDWGHHWMLLDRTGEITGEAAATPLGSIGTRPLGVPGRGDLGYWLGEAYWGRGLMAEAIEAVVRHAFGPLRMAKIEAEVFTENARGLALLDKLGFRREGLLRRAAHKDGRHVDCVVFGILPGEL